MAIKIAFGEEVVELVGKEVLKNEMLYMWKESSSLGIKILRSF
jgi:hypothetical protein